MAAPNIPDDVAAEVGRAILTALANVSQAPAVCPALPPCETCDSTGWDPLPDEVDEFGHIYSSFRPCPDCERIGSRAAA